MVGRLGLAGNIVQSAYTKMSPAWGPQCCQSYVVAGFSKKVVPGELRRRCITFCDLMFETTQYHLSQYHHTIADTIGWSSHRFQGWKHRKLSFKGISIKKFVAISYKLQTSLVAPRVKNLPVMPETWVPSLGREDPLEKEMATHSCLKNSMNRGGWWATVHQPTKNRTWLKDLLN